MGCQKLTYRKELPTLKVVKGLFSNEEKSCTGLYRYGFNGQEKDGEVSGEGNSYDYGFRIYNPRLGRFLSTDPYENIFSAMSPYSYALNNPIRNIDRDGLWPLDANLHIMIGKYGKNTILKEGDWTVIRATSLAEAVKLMVGGKVYDNLLISTHGSGVSGGKGGFRGGSGSDGFISNQELAKTLGGGVSSTQIVAFSEILNYLGKDANIALGACNSANSERFNELIYDFIEGKLGDDFSFYASTGRINNITPDKPEPLLNKGLVKPIDIMSGLGFRKIEKGGVRSDETFNLRIGGKNPWFSGIFDFSALSGESKVMVTSPKGGESKSVPDKGNDTQENVETVYRNFKSDPNDQ